MRRMNLFVIVVSGSLLIAAWAQSTINGVPKQTIKATTGPTAKSYLNGLGTYTTPLNSCTVVVGDPGAASPVLADDNDTPAACGNMTGADVVISAVGCWADAGSPTVTPILTGGTSTSILTGALTCGTASWAAGTVNGTPTLKTFTGAATCSSTPCTINANITTAGGTAKYIMMQFRF